jgi:hypothetical protein
VLVCREATLSSSHAPSRKRKRKVLGTQKGELLGLRAQRGSPKPAEAARWHPARPRPRARTPHSPGPGVPLNHQLPGGLLSWKGSPISAPPNSAVVPSKSRSSRSPAPTQPPRACKKCEVRRARPLWVARRGRGPWSQVKPNTRNKTPVQRHQQALTWKQLETQRPGAYRPPWASPGYTRNFLSGLN